MTTPKIESRARIGFFSSFDAVRHVLKKNSSTGMQKKMNASVESAPNTLPGISQPTAAAAKAGKNALCILTISDHIYAKTELSSEERQVGFGQMMEVALELI